MSRHGRADCRPSSSRGATGFPSGPACRCWRSPRSVTPAASFRRSAGRAVAPFAAIAAVWLFTVVNCPAPAPPAGPAGHDRAQAAAAVGCRPGRRLPVRPAAARRPLTRATAPISAGGDRHRRHLGPVLHARASKPPPSPRPRSAIPPAPLPRATDWPGPPWSASSTSSPARRCCFCLPGGQAAASPAPFADAICAGSRRSTAATLVAAFAVISRPRLPQRLDPDARAKLPLALARAASFRAGSRRPRDIGTPLRAQLVSSLMATLLILSNYSRSMAELFSFSCCW